jgi:hypothetical protein
MIVRSWNLGPRPGRYDDAIGLITEGAKLADRHGAGAIRLTQAATAGAHTGQLVMTCEFDTVAAYGSYLDDTMTDPEAQAFSHRIREAEAPFTYESTAVLMEIDLERADGRRDRGRVLDARLGRPQPGRWDDALDLARGAFDLCDAHGAVGCRLFQLNHAGQQSGLLCAVMEYDSMREYGQGIDAWVTDPDTRGTLDKLRSGQPIEAVSSGLYTEVAIL